MPRIGACGRAGFSRLLLRVNRLIFQSVDRIDLDRLARVGRLYLEFAVVLATFGSFAALLWRL